MNDGQVVAERVPGPRNEQVGGPRGDAEDLLVTMDADDTMDPGLIPAMLRAALEGADLVIAFRFAGGSEAGVPRLRKLYSRAARLLIAGMFPLPGVRDYTCGFRMYRVSLLSELSRVKPGLFDAAGFTAPTELLLNLSHLRPNVAEVPLHLRYDRKVGRSKMRVVSTLWQYLRLLLRLRLGNGLFAARPRLEEEKRG
ncbi:MAG: glycosyltransferase [Deinococcota bacterium]|nr:glycosyltransferase [Deinococcota bacterium]